VAIYHLQALAPIYSPKGELQRALRAIYNKVIYSAAILQAMSLCVENALGGADNELTINEVFLNAFRLIAHIIYSRSHT
jgi:hypothetical protein